MIKLNEYFDGKVKSLGFSSRQGPATVGVMAEGEYEFGTATVELMKVVSGRLSVKLPGSAVWEDYVEDGSFTVPAKAKFQVRVLAETAYICWYK